MKNSPANEPIWSPSLADVAAGRMKKFQRSAEEHFSVDPSALHAWSINHPEQFWSMVWDECGVVGFQGERTFVAAQPGAPMSSAQFFPDASLSVVENLLATTGSGEAMIAIDEAGNRRVRTWDELGLRVASIASALQSLGVIAGDCVAVWLPNSLEAVEVMLGAASIGAVFSSSSPDFGANGVLDRFGQISPKVLFAVDGYSYNGKSFNCLERLAEIRRGLPSVVETVVVNNVSTDIPDGCVGYEAFVGKGSQKPIVPMRFGFDHPWYVLYSSGTTGVPKCIVHRTGGVLLQHMKEHQLHCNIKQGDRVMYFTTTGWMMWNWLVSVLASGATAVLFDGAPTAPTMSRLFDIVDEERITLLGVSAKFIDSLRKADLQPKNTHALNSLLTICSTGSPLAPEGFDWVYQSVKTDVHLASISGGTDLCGCFVGGNPTKPVYRGEIQGPMLGMAVDVVDEQLSSLHDAPLTPGELVCRHPFPSMPIGFWNDANAGMPHTSQPGPKFVAAYFERLSGMWAQGDFASWTANGGMIIHGRSDTTLNPGGVRIGTAEIYRVVEQHADVLESLVFGQDWDNDVRIVLLVHLADNAELTNELIADLKQRIRVACTPRHVPALVVQVHDLPKTRSNKLVELALADAVNGRPVRNSEAIANPECIAVIAAMDELRR